VKFNFSAPSVSATHPQDAPGLGLTMVTFLGQNFGVADYSPTGMVGKQDCLISKWVSDSSLLCQVPRSPEDNVNGMYKAGVKVAGVASQITKDFRYMIAPHVVSVEPSTGVARGGSRINITGSGFGTSAETVVARINSEDCLETIWESQSSLVCISPAGAGARRSGPGGGSTAAGRRLLAACQQAHRRSAAQAEGSKAHLLVPTDRHCTLLHTHVTDLSAV
jgi:hypothetical protein